MSATAADAPAAGPLRTTSDREPKRFDLSVSATAAGAITATALKQSDTNLSIVKNAGTTGQYDLTFPPAPGVTGANCRVILDMSIYSPASTVTQWRITARNFSAGTMSIVFSGKTGTDAYLASGDELDMTFDIDTKPGK